MALRPGLSAEVELQVGPDDTAQALGSGDVPVLGTPRVLALVEQATVAAVRDELDPGQTTVGTLAEIEHLLPTPVGRRVRAQARLTEVDGRALSFGVTVIDGDRVAAAGRVRRTVVDRERFLARARG